jgi:NADH:ubiquinone oxidoreductase subunit 5 (subunit L)/multisubunit Na+/H+ antiporter MnhA subunit
MKIRLNYWQLILLFLPIILGMQVFHIPLNVQITYRSYLRMFNIISSADICFIVCYQAYLAISFNNSRLNKPAWFNVNALIPVFFNIAYFFYVISLTFKTPTVTTHQQTSGPMPIAHYSLFSMAMVILLVHALITFLFINTPFVSRQIIKIDDSDEQARLREDYLNPMKKLLRMSMIVFAVGVILSIILDSVTYFKPN